MTWRQLRWRCIYVVLSSSFAVGIAVTVLRAYAALRGAPAADAALGLIERRYVYSGWPYYEAGWVNLHWSRWATEVRRRRRGSAAVRPKRNPRPGKTPRVACVGRFAGLLGFPMPLLAACPVELVVADIAFGSRRVPALAEVAMSYRDFDWDGAGNYEAELDRVASFLREQDVDLLVNIGFKQDFADLLDRVDIPCVANLCTGSDLMHHPKVDIQLHGQPEADYFVAEGRMFCGTTGTPFSKQFVHAITGYMDQRGGPLGPGRSWSAREPLVVCHGSLYKFGRPELLDVLCGLLAGDSLLELALIGKDDGQALARVEAHASRWNVSGRVHYLGQFSAVRNSGSDLDDRGWDRVVDLLGRARLAPDPFPLGGGSSRFEAYGLGAPTVHMGVRFDPEAWGRTQPGNCEIPSLRTERGTAWSVDEYRRLCGRCLTDGAFADALVAEQLDLARNIADAPRWWHEVLAGYDRWRELRRPMESH